MQQQYLFVKIMSESKDNYLTQSSYNSSSYHVWSSSDDASEGTSETSRSNSSNEVSRECLISRSYSSSGYHSNDEYLEDDEQQLQQQQSHDLLPTILEKSCSALISEATSYTSQPNDTSYYTRSTEHCERDNNNDIHKTKNDRPDILTPNKIIMHFVLRSN